MRAEKLFFYIGYKLRKQLVSSPLLVKTKLLPIKLNDYKRSTFSTFSFETIQNSLREFHEKLSNLL